MALRTAEQYLASLRDGRSVYLAGARVDDATAHAALGLKARQLSQQYGRGANEDPGRLAMGTVTLPDGDRIRRWFHVPRTQDDLRQLIEAEEVIGEAQQGAISAGLTALKIVARSIDAKTGSAYLDRVERYADWLARNDLLGGLAMTDAKGDRSKPPSGQVDPDLWLRVVDRRPDGIVIRGAKTSVTNAALTNEFLVLPTHAMSAADRDWSVACAVPANAPGVVLISNYVGDPWGERFSFDRPLSHSQVWHDATIIFDDVFVPWGRVFMDGENDFTRPLISYFTTFHRVGILAREPKATKKLVGAAQLMARYNGLEGVGHIRTAITDMIQTAQLLEVLRFTAMARTETIEGICVPDAVACNLAGLTTTEKRPGYLTFLCELAGGPVLTAPSGLDLENSETSEYVRKYYVGRDGVSAEDRLRVVKYIYDIAASDSAGFTGAMAVTAAGSPAARRVAVTRSFDVDACVDLVMKDLERSRTPDREPALA